MIRPVALFVALTVAICGMGVETQARIVRIDITSTEKPAFGGFEFPGVGPYEKLQGKAYGEIDPNDPLNAVIVDIANAPHNSAGRVEYWMEIYILKPITGGNGKVLYEINNRGNKVFGGFDNSTGGNNPSTAANVQNSFLMQQGYTLVWSGWDPSAPPGGDRLTITVPVLSGVTGPSYEYFVFDNPSSMSAALTYAAATTDKTQATLTVREHITDDRVPISADGWEYVDNRTIRLTPAPQPFLQGHVYEFMYTA